MNDLHTNQGKAAGRIVARKAKPKVRVPNVFHTRITAPTTQLHHAQRQAARKTVRAAQRVPAVKTNNRYVTRLVQRENPQYRKNTRRTLAKVKRTAAVPPEARHKRNPRLHIIALRVLQSGPGTGMKVFGNHPFGAYADDHGIHVTPDSVHQSFDHSPATSRKARVYAREIPIHEYAHTLQVPHIVAHGRSSRALTEGGAEAFKLVAAHDIGLPPVAAPAYAKWARRILIGKGLGYVTRGQFR